MMTNSLRILVGTRMQALKTALKIKDMGYRRASDQKEFPYIVWNFTDIRPMEMGRQDYIIDFDVWTKSELEAFEIMDAIEQDLTFLNIPQFGILPTFYLTSKGTIDDPDKTIIHGLVRMECQVYAEGVTDAGILRKELINGHYD